MMDSIIVLLAFGFAGAFLCSRLRLPAGALIGTIVGVSGGSAILGFPPVAAPQEAKQALQIMVGLLVGLKVSRNTLSSGARSLVPAFLITAIMMFAGIISALIAVRFTSVGLITVLFAAAPGGITQMSMIGASLGADGAAIAAVHLARLLLASVVVVAIFTYLKKSGRAQSHPIISTQSESYLKRATKLEGVKQIKRFVATVLVGAVVGLIGLATPVPAGGVIGALFGSAAIRLWKPGPMPAKGIHLGVQILGGGVIGLGVTGEFLNKLADLAGAGGLIVSVYMLMWFAMFYFFTKLFGFDSITAVFASAPGGMAEAISGAAQAGASPIIVAFVHLVRLSATIAVIPSLIVFVFIG